MIRLIQELIFELVKLEALQPHLITEFLLKAHRSNQSKISWFLGLSEQFWQKKHYELIKTISCHITEGIMKFGCFCACYEVHQWMKNFLLLILWDGFPWQKHQHSILHKTQNWWTGVKIVCGELILLHFCRASASTELLKKELQNQFLNFVFYFVSESSILKKNVSSRSMEEQYHKIKAILKQNLIRFF